MDVTGKNAFANQMKFKGQFFVGFLCAIGQVLRNMCVPVAPLYLVILISYVHYLVFLQVLTELTCFYLGQDAMLQLKCVLLYHDLCTYSNSEPQITWFCGVQSCDCLFLMFSFYVA